LRITNGILAKEAVSGYQTQLRALDDARRQASTGLRVNKPSDDPVAVASIMQSSSELRALEQYRTNVDTGQSRLDIEDSVLDQLGNALTRVKELALSQGADPADAQSRATTKVEIDGLIDFATDLGNTQLSGIYIFGGQYADSPPFVAGVHDPARPPSGSFQVEIGTGNVLETNHSAQEIFLDSDALDAMRELSTALGNDDPQQIQAATTRLDAAFQNVQELVGDLGARMTQLDVTGSNLDSLEVTLQTFRSDLGDADMAQAISELVTRQGALEAAMLANSRIMNITLADYL